MNKIVLIAASVAMLAASAVASAASTQGVVQEVSCAQVARDGSAGGAVVGTALGAAIGEGVANWLGFGGAGRAIGTALGGVGGAAAGESVAATYTYECLLVVNSGGRNIITKVVSKKQYSVGQNVVVTALTDGSYHVR